MSEKLWRYLRQDKRKVSGWLQRVDAEIIGAILEFQSAQGIGGGCAEIGVHQGKSFIPLCMALGAGERAICIDVFDQQEKNLDASGRGDLSIFQDNLAAFQLDTSTIDIIQASSEEVSPAQILDSVGPVRFFSVDGGHWRSVVQNDLRLAEETLSAGGVIALDDYFRADWPDVTYGYTLWQEATESDIIPFAIGSNKLFLCRQEFAGRYRAALRTDFLKYYFAKHYVGDGIEVDSYRVEPFNQDEESDQNAKLFDLKLFRPDMFIAVLQRYGRQRRNKR